MSRKMKSGEDTLMKDKDGKAITVHCYVADEGGSSYYINSFCQAVPTGEGVATPLEDLVKAHQLRVLSATEVLQIQAAKSGISAKKAAAAAAKAGEPEKKARKPRLKVLKPSAEQPDREPAEGAEKAPEPGNAADISNEDIKAELALVIQTIPTKMLADELRRRGFVFCAVKPVVIEL